ncbi:AAA family ATPase [Thermoplasmatales archaeon SG8-52-1]|nr:MAG: AAA family ATPase [Thermoplasmatales archaeon SG8-52-1]
MILKTLTLKNFRKFKNATLEFPDGVTGVIGLNGAGKSTIFEAIAWVLYGSVAARTSVDEIRRINVISSESCRVELDFVFEGDTYRIVREMSGKSLTTSATVTVNGKIAATGADIVSKYIQKKLSMDFKSFFTSIFAKQKELNTLSTMVSSERRPLILRMLGIDSLDEVIKEIKSDKREKENFIEKISQDLTDKNGKDKIEVYKEEINKFDREKKENEGLIKKSKEELSSISKQLVILEKNCIKTKDNFEKINNKKEELSEKKIQFEEKEKISEELKELNNKISERKKLIDQQKKNFDKFIKVDSDIIASEKRINELKNKIEELIKKIEQKKTIVDRLNNDIKDFSLKKQKIEQIGPNAKCPTCERVLADQYKNLIENYDADILKKEKEIELLINQIKDLKKEKERFSREEQAFQKKKNYLQVQIREKEKIKTTIQNINTEIDKETIELKNKEKRFNVLKPITFDKKEFMLVTKQVDEFFKLFKSALEERDSKKDEVNSLKIAIERKESDRKLISQKIQNLKEKISELEDSKIKIKEEKIVVQHLGMLSEVMSNFRTNLISRIRPTLSSYSSDFFDKLTDGKYRELELDENYNLLVFDNGVYYGIQRFSGGEEDLANLCLRLAISEVITERAGGVFNFIILDEIFGSQDMFRRQNIMKALNGLSSKFRQIFLITHVDDVKNDMENIIFVTENEEGISTIKVE